MSFIALMGAITQSMVGSQNKRKVNTYHIVPTMLLKPVKSMAAAK
jgi:hypothetical protein